MERLFRVITRRLKRRLVIASVAFWVPVLIFIKLADDVRDNDALLLDRPITDFVQSFTSDSLTWLAKLLTHGGDLWFILLVLAVVSVYLFRKNRQRDFLAVLFSVGGAGFISFLLKLLFQRERPSLELALVSETTFSFPSGHSMGSAALGLILIIMFWRSRYRWLVFAVSSFYIVIVGLTRVYLGAHYPSDVVAAWCLSAAWVLVVYIALEHPASVKRYLQKLHHKLPF